MRTLPLAALLVGLAAVVTSAERVHPFYPAVELGRYLALQAYKVAALDGLNKL